MSVKELCIMYKPAHEADWTHCMHWFFSLVKMSWWSFHRYIYRCLTSGYFHGLLYVTPSGMDCEHLRASWLCLQFLTRVIMTSEDVECGVIDCFHVAFLPWQLMVTTVVVCFWRFKKKKVFNHSLMVSMPQCWSSYCFVTFFTVFTHDFLFIYFIAKIVIN